MQESRLTGSGSPFELVNAVLDGWTYRTYRHGPKTLNDLYLRVARSPEREFLIKNEFRFSNATILRQAAALGHVLSESFHIRRGTRVGLALDGRPEWLIGFVAITSIGATAVALPNSANSRETLEALGFTDCTLVLADETLTSQLVDCGYRGSLITLKNVPCHDGGLAFPFHLGASIAAVTAHYTASIDPEQLALIAFTSGSTGHSKGVMVNHRSLMHGMMNMLLGAALNARRSTSNDRVSGVGVAPVSLLTAPFSHISGYSHLLLMLFLGGTVVVLTEWDTDAARALIKREAITSISTASPTMVQALVSSADDALHSLKSIGIHGVSLVPSLVTQIRSHLPHVNVGTGYGMTETNGTICAIANAQLIERPTSAGRALPTVDMRIAHGDSGPKDSAGEILVRGAMLMQGYCGSSGNPSNTSVTEWFATGDWGHVDADGFVHVTDRAAHITTCNGRRISCGPIERSLLESGLVKDVAVIGGPEVNQGDRLVVIAVPAEGLARCEQAILERLSDVTHANLLAPATIFWATALPHTRSGKIDRHQLRQHLTTPVAG